MIGKMKKEKNDKAQRVSPEENEKRHNNPAFREEEELELNSLFDVQGGKDDGNNNPVDCGLGCYTGGLF